MTKVVFLLLRITVNSHIHMFAPLTLSILGTIFDDLTTIITRKITSTPLIKIQVIILLINHIYIQYNFKI